MNPDTEEDTNTNRDMSGAMSMLNETLLFRLGVKVAARGRMGCDGEGARNV